MEIFNQFKPICFPSVVNINCKEIWKSASYIYIIFSVLFILYLLTYILQTKFQFEIEYEKQKHVISFNISCDYSLCHTVAIPHNLLPLYTMTFARTFAKTLRSWLVNIIWMNLFIHCQFFIVIMIVIHDSRVH